MHGGGFAECLSEGTQLGVHAPDFINGAHLFVHEPLGAITAAASARENEKLQLRRGATAPANRA